MFTARMRWARVQRPDQLSSRSSAPSVSKAWLIFKSVADSIEGLDGVELRVDGPELAPDSFDVAVDRPVVDIDVVLVGDVEQLVAALHHSGTLGERLEDQELGHRQGDVLAVPDDLVPSRVHGQPPALQERGFGFVLS